MYWVELSYDRNYLATMRDFITRAPVLFRARIERNVLPQVKDLADRMLVEPGPVVCPIEWTSERQRRYVLGYVLERDAEGHIIPYQRTHELIEGWEVVLQLAGDSFAVALTNPFSYTVFVMGKWQQRFHANTGWASALDAAQVMSLETNDLLITAWSFMVRDWAKGIRE
jgi:hypothetical protein